MPVRVRSRSCNPNAQSCRGSRPEPGHAGDLARVSIAVPGFVVVVTVIDVSVDVEVVRSVTGELVQAFGRLLPQLSRSAEALDAEALHELVDWPGNHLLVAHVDERSWGR